MENSGSEWCLERRPSSGFLVWKKDESKVRFRFEVEVLEYEKDPEEHKLMHDGEHLKFSSSTMQELSHTFVVCVTCVAAVAATLFVPWLVVGSS